MKKNRIFDAEYASQTELTCIEAGYINKTAAGCGLTSLAIEKEKGNVVICVPSNELLYNKVSQYPNARFNDKLLGVNGETSIDDVDAFVNARETFKIMVTYDSIDKVAHLLEHAHLVIDESDRLLSWAEMKAKSKRGKMDVMNHLLEIAEKYKDTVSFISATPVPVEYFGREWMKEIDQITYNWTKTITSQALVMRRTYVIKALIDEILIPLKNDGRVSVGGCTFSKVIVFYNSVDGVKGIIDRAGLNPDECGIKCGSSVRNSCKISIDNEFKCNNLPKYTFVTSSGFSGIDLYDKEAMSIVVSSTSKEWQMIDLKTELQQAISRQRDKSNPNYGKYIFIYNISDFDKSEEDLMVLLNQKRKKIEDSLSIINEISDEDMRKKSLISVVNSSEDYSCFAMEKQGKQVFNELLFNAAIYSIVETRRAYTKGFNIMGAVNRPILIEPNEGHEITYGMVLEKYKDMLAGEPTVWSEEEKYNYSLVDRFYQATGCFDSNSRRVRIYLEENKKYSKIKQLIPMSFKDNHDYTTDEAKELLRRLYKMYGLNRKAKATDLAELGFERVQLHNGTRVYRKGA